MPEIIWKRGAEDDLLSIFGELEEYRDGAGEIFAQELDVDLESIRSYPASAPVFEHPMRRLVLRGGRYGVFYTAEDRGLIIHAILPLRQDPGRIRAKILRLLGLR